MRSMLFVMLVLAGALAPAACSKEDRKTDGDPNVTDAGNPDDDIFRPKPGSFRGLLARQGATGLRLGDAAAPADVRLVATTFAETGRVQSSGAALGKGAVGVAFAGDVIYYIRDLENATAEIVLLDPAQQGAGRETTLDIAPCAPGTELSQPTQLAYDGRSGRLYFTVKGWKDPQGDREFMSALCAYDVAAKTFRLVTDAWGAGAQDEALFGLFFSSYKERLYSCAAPALDASDAAETIPCAGLRAYDPDTGARAPAGDIALKTPIDLYIGWFRQIIQVSESAADPERVAVINLFTDSYDADSFSRYEFFGVNLATGDVGLIHSSRPGASSGPAALEAAGGCDARWAAFASRHEFPKERKYALTIGYGAKKTTVTEIEWFRRPSADSVAVCMHDAATAAQGIEPFAETKADILAKCGKDANYLLEIAKEEYCEHGIGVLPGPPAIDTDLVKFRTQTDGARTRVFRREVGQDETPFSDVWIDPVSLYEVKAIRYAEFGEPGLIESVRELVAVGDDVER